jgi:hypothetical protein
MWAFKILKHFTLNINRFIFNDTSRSPIPPGCSHIASVCSPIAGGTKMLLDVPDGVVQLFIMPTDADFSTVFTAGAQKMRH